MPIRTYVQRRKAGTYYFRRKLPAHLKLIINKAEFVRSLETSNPRRALKEAVDLEYKLEDIFKMARETDTGNVMKALLGLKEAKIREKHMAKSQVYLEDVYTKWVERREPSKASLAWANHAIKKFYELHGRLPLEQITKQHGFEFVNYLFSPRYSSGKKLTSSSVTRIFGPIKTLLNFAEQNGMIESNPLGKVRVERRDDSKEIKPFSIEELSLIFNSPVYTSYKSATRRLEQGDLPPLKDSTYWLPLMALFTGARQNELAQLDAKDIQLKESIYFISINDKNKKRVKNKSSIRDIPIHAELIRCGLLNYTKSILDSREGKLFPELPHEGEFKPASAFSKRFARLLNSLGITDPEKVFHSFRHTFKTWVRNVEEQEEIHDRITGHTSNSVGRRYGAYSLDRLNQCMQKVVYKGLGLTHLYATDPLGLDSFNLKSTTKIPARASHLQALPIGVQKVKQPANFKRYYRFPDFLVRYNKIINPDSPEHLLLFKNGNTILRVNFTNGLRKDGKEYRVITEPEAKLIAHAARPVLERDKKDRHHTVFNYLSKDLVSLPIAYGQHVKTGQVYQLKMPREFSINEILLSRADIEGIGAVNLLFDPDQLEYITT